MCNSYCSETLHINKKVAFSSPRSIKATTTTKGGGKVVLQSLQWIQYSGYQIQIYSKTKRGFKAYSTSTTPTLNWGVPSLTSKMRGAAYGTG